MFVWTFVFLQNMRRLIWALVCCWCGRLKISYGSSWLSFVVSTVSLSLSHWYPGSGVVLDCIDSWSLHPYLLLSRYWEFCLKLFFYCLNGDSYGKSRLVRSTVGSRLCDIGCDEGKNCVCVFAFSVNMLIRKLLHFHNWLNDDPQRSALPIMIFNRGFVVSSFAGGTALCP